MEEPGFVAETLAWCNERRAEDGKEPLECLPRGRRFNAISCPCGAAAGLSVGFTSFCKVEGEGEAEDGCLPSPVVRFVEAFDGGQLPQYDEEHA